MVFRKSYYLQFDFLRISILRLLIDATTIVEMENQNKYTNIVISA